MRIQIKVLEKLGDGKYIVSHRGRKFLAKSSVPLKIGSFVETEVEALEPYTVLRIKEKGYLLDILKKIGAKPGEKSVMLLKKALQKGSLPEKGDFIEFGKLYTKIPGNPEEKAEIFLKCKQMKIPNRAPFWQIIKESLHGSGPSKFLKAGMDYNSIGYDYEKKILEKKQDGRNLKGNALAEGIHRWAWAIDSLYFLDRKRRVWADKYGNPVTVDFFEDGFLIKLLHPVFGRTEILGKLRTRKLIIWTQKASLLHQRLKTITIKWNWEVHEIT